MSSWRKNRPVLTIQICHEKVTSRCRPVLALDEACSPSCPGGRPCPVPLRALQGQPYRGDTGGRGPLLTFPRRTARGGRGST